MTMLTQADHLDQAAAIADARLGVAEQLSWPIGCLAACCVYLKWDSLLLAIPLGIVAAVFVTWEYRKAHDKAWQAIKDYQPPVG